MAARPLTEEEFLGWKASLGTKAVETYLYRCLEALKSQWAMGLLSRDNANEQKFSMDSAIAQYRTIEDLLKLDYEQYSEVMNDDDYREHIGAGANGPRNLMRAVSARTDRERDRDSGARDVAGADERDAGDGD